MTRKIHQLISHSDGDRLASHIQNLSRDRKECGAFPISSRLLASKDVEDTEMNDGFDLAKITADIQIAVGLSILQNACVHEQLYGRHQGRKILQKIRSVQPGTIIIVAPSYQKECGIGEYARYLESIFKDLGKKVICVRTSNALLKFDDSVLDDAMVLINHGPGLFDGFNPKLGQGESTMLLLSNLGLAAKRGALPVFLLHSLIDIDQPILFSRQQMIADSPFPTITFVSSAAKHFYIPYTELGISPVSNPISVIRTEDVRSTRQERIGFFGFFQYGGKDFDSLLHLASSLRAKLVGSVATSTSDEVKQFETILSDSGISHDFGSGWVTDSELAERLSDADYFYLPQNDYDHWNNSATARFVMNFDKPVFVPPHHPFLDASEGVVFATKEDLPRVVSYFRESTNYDMAVSKTRKFRNKADMHNTATSMMGSALDAYIEDSMDLLTGVNERSLERYIAMDAERQRIYLDTLDFEGTVILEDDIDSIMKTGLFDSVYLSVGPKQYWRKHYDIQEFVQNSILEGIHTIYRALYKQEISFKQILKICQYVRETDLKSAADILCHAIQDALSQTGENDRFSHTQFALSCNGKLISDESELLISMKKCVTSSTDITAYLRSKSNEDSFFQPSVNNFIELLVMPPDEICNRRFPVCFDNTELVKSLASALTVSSLHQRFNAVMTVLTDHDIDISSKFLMDHPVVRAVESKRMCYRIEDFIYYDNDDFILNAVRSLCKRDPFAIEHYALQQMLISLGKVDVLSYISSNPSCQAKLACIDTTSVNFTMSAFTDFVNLMRDPLSGGISLRNEYLVRSRHNNRWKLACSSLIDQYYSEADADFQAMLSTYHCLAGQKADYESNKQYVNEFGNVSSWLSADGYFHNLQLVEKNIVRFVPGETLQLGRLPPDQSSSLIGFHKVEVDGAWTMSKTAKMMLCVEAGSSDKLVHDEVPVNKEEKQNISTDESYCTQYQLELKMRVFGSNYLAPRIVSVSITSELSDSCVVSTETSVDKDESFTTILKLPVNTIGKMLVIDFSISDTANPSVLQGSVDARDLGIMVQSVTLQYSGNQLISKNSIAA